MSKKDHFVPIEGTVHPTRWVNGASIIRPETKQTVLATECPPLIQIHDVNILLLNTATNRDAFQRMLEVIRSGQAIAFFGAGVSRGLGYPTWQRLIQQLAEATVHHCGENIVDDRGKPLTVEQLKQINDLLFQAEIFKVNLQGQYFEIIRQTFQPRESNSDTRALVSIPFQHLLTSNYDFALENAHSDIGKRFETMTLYDGSAGNFINRLGDYSFPRHIIQMVSHAFGLKDRHQSEFSLPWPNRPSGWPQVRFLP